MTGGLRPKLVHRPELVARDDGLYEVHCGDCRARSDEDIPIGIGLPVSNRAQALEMLRNHVGPAAWRSASAVLPGPGPVAAARRPAAGRTVASVSRTA